MSKIIEMLSVNVNAEQNLCNIAGPEVIPEMNTEAPTEQWIVK
jgi:hypothetical protein